MEEKSRTLKQNNGYYKWRTELANECVAKGINAVVLFKDPAEIPVTEGTIHYMMHKISEAKYGKESTAELTTKELTDCANDLRNIISLRSQGEVNIPFPSEERLKTIEELWQEL